MQRIEVATGEHPHFIGCWKLEPPSVCDDIIDVYERHNALHQAGRSGVGLNTAVKKSTDLCVKPAELSKQEYGPVAQYMKALFGLFEDYRAQWPFLGANLPTVDIGEFNIQKYDSGGHFAQVHSERMNMGSAHRVLVWMTYLNDVERGGETEFPHYGLKVRPERGKTLIWPAEWTHCHSGNVVEAGPKYIITGWMHFPI